MSKAVISIIIITIVISLITFILSCWEVKDVFINSEFLNGGSCDDVIVPFRATYQNEHYVLQCGWTITRTGVRLFYLLLFFVLCVLYFISIAKKKTLLFLVTTILIILDGVVGFYSFIADAKSASNGNGYCKDIFKFYISSLPVEHDCSPGRFYGVVALNILTTLLFFVVGLLSFFKRTSLFATGSYGSMDES